MAKLKTVNKRGNSLESLKKLSSILAEKIDLAEPRDLPSLSKQYRETLIEIERLEGMTDSDDEISEILSERKADGKSGSVR